MTTTQTPGGTLAAAVGARAEQAIDRLSWDAERIRDHQETQLRRLLRHAVDHSPFHRRRLDGIDPEAITLDRLAELPVMTKAEMMAGFDDVVTDRRLRRADVDAHVTASPGELTLLHDEFVVMASGGSSGQRGVFVYDREAAADFALSIVRASMRRLIALGVTGAAPIPGALIAAGSSIHGTAVVGQITGGPGARVHISHVPATLPFAEIVARLEQLQPLMVTGYPSVLVRLAAERAAGRLSISPLAVGATSEPLDAATRTAIETAFGVAMSDTFGSTEGLCGVSEPGSPDIVFASDLCITEIGDGRVLVTNLYNRTQPLIRYELTDRFVEVPGPHPDGHLRARVEGRRDEPFRYGAVEIHPFVIRAALVTHSDLFEYQVRQTASGIDVDAVSGPGFNPAAAADALVGALARAGLAAATVHVTTVPALQRDPATGKVRRFVAAAPLR